MVELSIREDSHLAPVEKLRLVVSMCPPDGHLCIPYHEARALLQAAAPAPADPLFLVLELPPPDDRMQPAVLIYTASLSAYYALSDLALALLRWLA